MGIDLYVICCFTLTALNLIFSLSLIFVSFITLCFSVFLLELILYGTLCYLDMGDCFSSHVREFFSYYLFNYFLRPFLSLWDPYLVNVGTFDVVSEVS